MQVLAYNNTPFRLTVNVSAWAAAYDLTTAEWVFTARRKAIDNEIAFEATTTGGGALYADSNVTFLADIADVDNLADTYDFDFGFVPVLGGQFIRVAGGTIGFLQGVSFP